MKKIILFFGMLFCFSAHAGVVMISDQTMTLRGQPSNTHSKSYIDVDKSKVELSGGMMGDQSIIFRKDKSLMWFIDAKKNTYTETTIADLQKSTAQMQESMKQMEAKMAAKGIKLPAHQAPEKPTYQKVGSGEKIGAWTCDHYEGTANGVKTQEMWTTSPSSLGLSDGDYQIMKNLGESMKSLNSSGTSSMPFFGEGGINGIPVKFIYYSKGTAFITNELKEASHQDVSASIFELPAGAVKNTTPNFQMPKQ